MDVQPLSIIIIILFVLSFLGLMKIYSYISKGVKYVDNIQINDDLILALDNYVNKIRSHETKIKLQTKKTLTKEEVLKEYLSSIKNFTYSEKQNLNYLINDVENSVEKYKKFRNQFEWNLVKLDNKIEWGMPFTLGNYIFLPEHVLKLSDTQLKSTLLHEQVHILQRRHQDRFNFLYERILGFKKINYCDLGDHLDKYRISNPDGMDVNWVFKVGLHWIMPMIIMEPNNNNNHDEYGVLVNIKNDGYHSVNYMGSNNEPVMVPLRNLHEYCKKLKRNNGIYHPNEYLAHSIEDAIYKNNKHGELLLRLFFN